MIPCDWHLVLCGISHKTAELAQREPLQIGSIDLPAALARFRDLPGVRETVIVATCNRIEFYFIADSKKEPFDFITSFYEQHCDIDIRSLRDNFYILKEKKAVSHLFEVSAGIDSMVLGENQIQGQVKEAYSSACKVKTAGKIMHRLFHQAFRIGKQVRSDTELGQGACSVSSATIEMLYPCLSQIENPSILFIGNNRMVRLAASRLARLGFVNFTFANRTAEKAVTLAEKYHASGFGLDELPELLTTVDVVITCTASELPIITDHTLSGRVDGDIHRPLIIADMAIPRDVVLQNSHDGIDVFDLQAVQKHVSEQQSHREEAIPQAKELIEQKLEQFLYWYDNVRHEPGYNGLGEAYEKIRRDELDEVLDTLPEESRQLVDRATRRLLDKLLHFKTRYDVQAERNQEDHAESIPSDKHSH